MQDGQRFGVTVYGSKAVVYQPLADVPIRSGQTSFKDIALRQPNWPERPTQIANCFSNQFEIPLLFYVLIALALPLRHADLIIVVLSWIFVITRLVHAWIFVTSNNVRQRSLAWFAGVLAVLRRACVPTCRLLDADRTRAIGPHRETA